MNELIERDIPHSVTAEFSVLGAVLLDESAIDSITTLKPEHFYVWSHQEIFRHMLRMAQQGKRIDVVTLAEALDDAGSGEKTGGLAYLGEIATSTPSSANVKRYAEIVQERSIERQLLAACDKIRGSVMSAGDTREKLCAAQMLIMEISESRQQKQARMIGDGLMDFVDRLERRKKGEARGTPTGISTLDQWLGGGLQDGNLVILAGRPSMGKSALSNTIAINIAEDGGTAAILSMEMTEDEQMDRVVAMLGRVPLAEVLAGNLEREAGDRISAAVGKMQTLPLVIDEDGGLTLLDVLSKARSIKRRFGMRLLVVDALGLMTYDASRSVTELGAITKALKALAKELSIPIILLCQLSRKCEDRPDKRPVLSDLRDSGSIEQDADVVLMLYREEYYNPDTNDKGIAELLIRKNRQGKTGTIPLAFVGEHVRFAALEGEWSRPEPAAPKTKKSRLSAHD